MSSHARTHACVFNAVLRLLTILGAGVLSGVLLALALPPYNQWWLGPVCLAPVIAAVSGQGLIRGFVGGIIAPVATFFTIQTGALVPGSKIGGAHWVAVGCGFFGFLIAIVCCFASEIRLTGWRRFAFLASTAILLELALFRILPAHLALSQYQMPGMMRLASVGGIWLVSLLLWACNVAVAERLAQAASRKAAAILLGVVVVVYLAGRFIPHAGGTTIRVAAIQTENTDEKTLSALNLQAGREGAVLCVWPEFAGIELAPGGDPSGLRELSAQPGQPPFVTSYRDRFEPLPHNTAALFDNGHESETYFKRKVFGGEANMHTPGTEAVAVKFAPVGSLGLNICYDSCYPRVLSETARLPNVSLVALPTIDPESTNDFIAAVHSAFTTFRASESGVPIVRADGGAYSTMADGWGRIVARKGSGEGVLVADVPIERHWTPYSSLGDWVLYICGAYVLFEALGGRRFRAKE